jgi:hypothetical protein
VLRKISGTKRDETEGEWRNLCNGELHKLYLRRLDKGYVVGGPRGMNGRVDKSVQGFGGKARRKETTWRTVE